MMDVGQVKMVKGKALLKVAEDKYLFGEKIVKCHNFERLLEMSEQREKFTEKDGRDYAYGMHSIAYSIKDAADLELFMTIWAKLQRNPDNLFSMHHFIERLIIETATMQENPPLSQEQKECAWEDSRLEDYGFPRPF